MKKKIKIVAIFALFSIILQGLVGCIITNSTDKQITSDVLDGLIAQLKNSKYEMSMNPDTLNIGIKNLENGEIWYTFPIDLENDKLASKILKDEIMSQIKITYYDKENQAKTLNTYNDCVLKKQYTVTKDKDKIQVEYTLGSANGSRIVPRILSLKSYEKILNVLESKDPSGKKRIELYYKFTSLEQMTSEKQKEDMKKLYPYLEKSDVYLLTSQVRLSELIALEKSFLDAGFTAESMQKEYEELNYESKEAAEPSFKIPVTYGLNQDGFYVTVDNNAITYDAKNFTLYKINVLNYFCSAQSDSNGYIFIPDGSGSIINFNKNGEIKIPINTGKLYGQDVTDLSSNDRNTYYKLPVYGIVKDKRGIFAHITSGSANAEITNEISGYSHSYNTVYSGYIYKNKAEYQTGDVFDLVWLMFEKEHMTEEYIVQYSFLEKENASYVGMAKSYKEYLISKGMKKSIKDGDIPLYIETLGSIKSQSSFMGIPYSKRIPLTTFKDNIDILKYYYDNGISNIKIKMTGFANGGLNSHYATGIRIERSLGTKEDFNNLLEVALNQGADIFGAVDMMQFHEKSFFDGYNQKGNGNNTIESIPAVYTKTDEATMEQSTTIFQYSVNTDSILKNAINVEEDADKLKLPGIALEGMGKYLPTDYKSKGGASRSNAMKNMVKTAQQITKNIMLDGYNEYLIPYAGAIMDLPMTDSNLNNYGEAVPFIQIALSGYKSCAGESFNLCDDIDDNILKSIEYGSMPNFVLSKQNQEKIRENDAFSKYFTSSTKIWLDKSLYIYRTMNSVLNEVSGQEIVNHQKLSEGIYKTTYASDKAIIVNYTNEDYLANNVKVMAKGFSIVGKEA